MLLPRRFDDHWENNLWAIFGEDSRIMLKIGIAFSWATHEEEIQITPRQKTRTPLPPPPPLPERVH